MSDFLAETLVLVLTVYSGLGLVFALVFVWLGVDRVDPGAQGAGIAFRLLILPGTAAFWPFFLYRWMRGIPEPPVEKNPHR